ncbi:PEGA domain-containing protein [Myxococcota bacterium]|nr:PEGA domain-containing protein [Myxococcota bacterium]
MARRGVGIVWMLAALGLAQGCIVHKVRVESEPAGARVELDGRFKGTTPTEFRVIYTPPLTRRYDVAVMLPGYRTVESTGDGLLHPSPLRQEVRLWRYVLHPFALKKIVGLEPRSTYRYALVEDHGPAGTWTSEELLD